MVPSMTSSLVRAETELSADFDNNSKSSFLPSMTVGLMREIRNNPYQIRKRQDSQWIGNDWYYQVSLGVGSLNYKGIGTLEERLSLLTPIVECGVGKALTKVWSGRFSFSGLYARSKEELFTYYNIRGDLIVDVVEWLNPGVWQTLFTVKPYAGVSFLARFDDQSNFLLGTAFGAMLSIRPNKNYDFYLDSRYLMTPPRFAHVSEAQETFSVGLATMSLGFSYYFTRRSIW